MSKELPEFLSQVDAADYLRERGVSVEPQTLARWRCTGRYRLRYLKIGNLVRYRRFGLDALVEEHMIAPGGGDGD
ncbi:MAG: helix-turn-helix domain-containing protein [Gammaproteobacteria bacterium]|nr:helix-turn-helix domain-containing protein [Gammaproteobacteria bacterium]NIR83126.1 helix-turn-helix domain-containing protein [Gammaproteobacteria bacterium]NIR90788.1 helix-turn-helix domain-containing protein [Gammaproteobacteria bacterium]NIU04279.1 helix-turn-helix domain-containing protein [Gammaproteobacteria bacterium]NIV51571.1 DNA-binding protein [Gammaproteobacteria bacterium]